MSSLLDLTLAEARDGLAKREFSSLELTEAYIGSMESARSLNAYIVETPDKARDMARAADDRIAKGDA
ncbi:MAG TPA: Asp-tRNA(Asn)/Glu-tRNA(Gln) amidotransferase subunit GatA, partial [Alphaproteobacteria bacterium]|nr:Asp-tRNA(Asn)/Glu-tRNA(Gln) amidotransferase subunit GatA [Alphaproteobacteria bacterium]